MPIIKIMDPVTRIEGHMKVEVSIDSVGGEMQIVDARCTGTLFRGFETLLAGRSPLDAPVITQRICGVCPTSHSLASVLALENVSEWLPTTNARLMRNLILGSNFIQSHILHFYLLAALDFVRGPAKAPWSSAYSVDLRSGLDQVTAHLADALVARRKAHEMGALLSGRMPAGHTIIPGGVTEVPTATQQIQFRSHLDFLTGFIDSVYIPDVEAIADTYADYFEIGTGCGNLMAFGVFEMDDRHEQKLFPCGYVDGGVLVTEGGFESKITESVRHSWYDAQTGNLNPLQGLTKPLYPKTDAYSWLKAPRLFDRPFETGPLARMWIGGRYQAGISVMDRHLARAHETLHIAQAMYDWLDELELNRSGYSSTYDQFSGTGQGLCEAPRGALGHWLSINNGKIDRYQIITPTCWNASPRDDNDVRGPMEQALVGTPVKDPEQPIEALRVIHSFDPCLSCAVHVIKPDGKAEEFRVEPSFGN